MARYRSRMSALHPVNRIKHVFDSSATLGAATNLELDLVAATDTPVLAITNAVETGCKINGIYLNVEVVSNETDVGAIPNVYFYIIKNVGDNLAVIDPTAVGSNDNKRFVIHQEMTMLNNVQGGNPRKMFNGVIVIPKGYRRFGPNDKLQIVFRSTALNIALCLQCHYKEFR